MLNYAILMGTLATGMVLRDTHMNPFNANRHYRRYPPRTLGANAATLLFLLILILWIWRDELLR